MNARRESPYEETSHAESPYEEGTRPPAGGDGPSAGGGDDYPGLPPRGGTVHRHTGRVVPLDGQDRALLLQGSEPDRPGWRFWFTIGGIADPGESLRQAAARELAEEAGVQVAEDALGEPYLESVIEFDWAGRRIVQHQTFFAVRLPEGARPHLGGLDAVEQDTTFGWGLRSVAQLEAEPDTLATPELPGYVAAAVEDLRRREGAPGPGPGTEPSDDADAPGAPGA